MHILKATVRPTLLVVAVVSLAMMTTTTRAHPPSEPDHGINESTFHTLWAGDEDTGNLTASNASSAIEALASASDIPLDRPPRAVETWNTGELGDLPTTDSQRSTHPQNAERTDGEYLRDVAVSIVATQPSTRVHLDEHKEPLYVAPDGDVLGHIDYRVAVPETDTVGSRTTEWTVYSHEVESVQLRLDGAVLNETNQTQAPTLSYSDLSVDAESDQRLTLEATVSVSLREIVTTRRTVCEEIQTNETETNETTTSTSTETNTSTETCRTVESTTSELQEETITVTDSVDVRVYALTVSGYQSTYPDGDMGLVTYKEYPWYGLSLPDGDIRGVWRFYVARDSSWDTLRTDGSGTSASSHSPVHPLQVHAYPIETGPTPWPRSSIDILEVYGTTYESPALPSTVTLDSIEGTYTGSFGIGTRVETMTHDLNTITAIGLVRGTNTTLEPDRFTSVSLTQSNLTLEVTNQSADETTVRATLQDAETGAPIDTSSREGYLHIAGEQYDTNASGQVSVTVSGDRDAVSARYEPGQWWRNIPGYTADSTVVSTGGTVLHYVDALFRGFIPIGVLLFGGYLISRFTGWNFWPPWRGL